MILMVRWLILIAPVVLALSMAAARAPEPDVLADVVFRTDLTPPNLGD